MHTQTIAQLAQGLKDKEFSSVELTQHYLKRIQQSDLNAFITVTDELAMAQAQAADEKIAKGAGSILTGIPYAHKDIFCTQGVKTSAGSKMLDNFIAPYDATVSHQLNQADTVMLGKVNMDEFAMGSSNENSFYGAVKNPWNTDKIPGGSSGGSAAAVAGGLSCFATGTDTGGSIRQPASLCGITGLKPTYGRVSRYGMIAYASSLDQAGPMTKTAEDAAIVLNAMAGFDEKDSTSAEQAVPDYTANLNDSVKGLTIGLPKEFFSEGLDDEVATQVMNAVKEFEAMGATVKEISLPNSAYAIPTYYIVAPCECSSNLSRLDGVRYGYRCDNPKDLEDLYLRSRSEGFGAEVKRRIMIGAYALSAGYYDAYYLKAQKTRHLISEDFKKAFNEVDVIMGPVSPTTAFDLGSVKDPVSMYLADIYTLSANLAGLPGMSIPAGFSNKLPVGLQLIGNYWSESKLLNIAHQFQLQTNWHQQMPQEN
ncbi:Asp-tRNA(Asn)/Glu-tRNA(Gln) amidotransferase subunit GatA [Candidatus Thioglobus sp.]|uniref:Asp-tRNA(Asn)/Glu-tRNA(Gln) amidotransferase subunit GatA n=1 Tax=Candidatus Thioglobus sp. TaxID=2026721 RepID=UPI001D2D85F0|nr:Asp-tRNA(Asn)/Glu-tRNA(Gln) amidotransferase subunit GatA [Candidatus Thioglobus sp.]MBT3277344.1 Asp-tRNA(Asn)/Glu-tRNA(Gln) amidotransferase subunit GatA [Candidatus Thioglobus sp.]MBT3446352.1 Asp-tRNA(Asn)/Glu-tRNA(Gln) amidotransferase subunit GatA [Candidatus Thioglobus sp.]MBT4422046.1 Asp-tRNA(Asn)/Glu-tRNA(Gln) amidotransferase subunit GatA [Candidatus Thioglobus sp.]MBT6279328.1 Asp-tRNA(Asn)/Glu-tRNA(Gln) amidotransferase subunit GatA [Candidatus Thioglobus sp.]MBT6753017.1 Asp-t